MIFPEININMIRSLLFIEDITQKINKIKLAGNISEVLNLQDEPAILPIPDDAPAEIPRIILKGNGYECQVSFKTINFIAKSDGLLFPDSIPTFISLLNQLIVVADQVGMNFSRIGVVVDGQLNAAPFDFITKYYLKEKKMSCNGYDIGFLFNINVGDLPFNKWVKFKNENDKVTYQIDYNTLADVSYDLSIEGFNKMLNGIKGELLKDPLTLFETNVISEG